MYYRFPFTLQKYKSLSKNSIAVRKHSWEILPVLENLQIQGKYILQNPWHFWYRYIHKLLWIASLHIVITIFWHYLHYFIVKLAFGQLKIKYAYMLFLQSFTKYLGQSLVFMWNTALREKFNFYFSRDFY